ncbi:hypothetical protein CPB84DRAFT_1928018 [Gymnopilus junonius]|uniref:Uncharacterized protein n=1 Tax=Gymnopilus junonius TaxID=109634 RepID=A0A9P5TEE3_GYMJU|nr:hypothetical protein CPB84DRAFT_1928018 [Gymnopilus junonius]
MREQYYCAITHFFDSSRAEELVKRQLLDEMPEAHQAFMEVAHIIPFELMFNNFEETTPFFKQRNTSKDTFQAWTQIDVNKFAMSSMNTSANTIYMARDRRNFFVQFAFYLDEASPVVPNKYKDPVEFPTLAESGIDLPNPEFLKIHAACAKVLNISGIEKYVGSLEEGAKNNDLSLFSREDFSALLRFKLAAFGH